jgi:hypothetical protein
VIGRIVESGCSNLAARAIMTRFANRSLRDRQDNFPLIGGPLHQRQNPLFFPTVIKGVKPPDFIDTTNGIQGVEKTCVPGCEFARLEVTAAQVRVAKCLGTLPREKVKTQPAAIRRRDALRFSEKGDKQ